MTVKHQPAMVRRDSWLDRPSHHAWLEDEGRRLLVFYRNARHPEVGFAALDDKGLLSDDAKPDALITARMTHCFSIAALRGEPGALPLAAHGVEALRRGFKDHEHGGWFSGLPAKGGDTSKQAYLHTFVALAAASASLAGAPNADGLLHEVVHVIEEHFWCAAQGAMKESFAADWSNEQLYRGGNSNMHATEAFLQLADVLDDTQWLGRALAMVERVIHRHARSNDYRIIEHFDQNWNPLPEYNSEYPADAFKPYGATPGHAFEWSRLLLHLESGLLARGEKTPNWLLEDAQGLFLSAARLSWAVDDEPGLIYTHDWNNRPVIHERMHWTLAEASCAAAALFRRTGNALYEQWYRRFWDYIDGYLIDRQQGSWHHELDRHNRPSHRVWKDKFDLYHAYQATLVPRLPLTPSMTKAIYLGHL